MCQVTPFTLPCCRRIYVSVEKLPSCPDGWPRKKCPKELIVQISGYEPKDVQHRDKGVCWRCLADRTGWDRESLRPVLDTAFIVEGLEEWNMEERRVRQEQAGLCWQCGADRGCETCGSGRTQYSGEKEVLEIKGKRGRAETYASRGKGTTKRLKVDHTRSLMSTPSLMASTPLFEKQLLDPLLQQRDLSPRDYGSQSSHDQFAQPAATFDYRPQEVQFRGPVSQYRPGTWQNGQSFQNNRISADGLGGGTLDPSGYCQQAEDRVQQSVNLSIRQSRELPPVLDFGADFVDLDAYNDIDDETIDRLLAERNDELFKPKEQDNRSTTQDPAPCEANHAA